MLERWLKLAVGVGLSAFGSYLLITGAMDWRDFGNSVGGPIGDSIAVAGIGAATIAGMLMVWRYRKPWIEP